MVKFSLLALSATIATAAAGSAKKTLKLSDRKLRKNDPATKALMNKARPYKKAGAGRKLANDDAWEIDGSYSLKFSECREVKTYDEDLFDEDVIAYAKEGSIVATKSFVLFHVCQDDDCFYESDEDLYIVDLATYLQNAAMYYANQRTDFCEQCERFDEYCNPEEEEEEAEEEEEEEDEDESEDEDEDEDEDRKLKKKRKLSKNKQRRAADKNYINCNKCSALDCFEDEENMDDGQQTKADFDNTIAEWVGELSECQETESYMGNLQLYVGAMCSPYGDGVELAVFANDECSLYTNQKAFSDVYNPNSNQDDQYANINYIEYAEDYIKNAFYETIPCMEVEYDDPDEDDDGNNGDDEEENRSSEYCENIMGDNAADFNNCQGGNAEEEENDDDSYSWYEFDMTSDNADDIDEVCTAIKAQEGQFYHAYDEKNSGSWYTRNKKGVILRGDEPTGMSGGAIALIALLCLGVVGAGAYIMVGAKKNASGGNGSYHGGTLS